MLSEPQILEMLANEMKDLTKAKKPEANTPQITLNRIENTIETLKEVLDEEYSFFALPGSPYSDQIKFAVAHVIRQDALKATLAVAVDLYGYDYNFTRYGTTDGWLVTDLKQDAPSWALLQNKIKSRKLFIPAYENLLTFGDTFGDAFFDTDGYPMINYLDDCDPDDQRIYQLDWTNIQTGERLHPVGLRAFAKLEAA